MKGYSVRGVKERLYIYGKVHEGDWYIDYDTAENDKEAQLFSVYKDGDWLADFMYRKDAESFISLKKGEGKYGLCKKEAKEIRRPQKVF